MWRSTWPGRSSTCTFRDDGLPSMSSTMSAISATLMSMPVATLITSPLTRSSARDDRLDRLGIVVDIDPVAARVPVTVDRQRLVRQRLRDEARDHLLRMLARSVVVERADDDDRQSVRDVVRVREPVGAGLRPRVRAPRIERVLLVHGRVEAPTRRPRSTRSGSSARRESGGSRRAGSASPRRSSSRTRTRLPLSTSPHATRQPR